MSDLRMQRTVVLGMNDEYVANGDDIVDTNMASSCLLIVAKAKTPGGPAVCAHYDVSNDLVEAVRVSIQFIQEMFSVDVRLILRGMIPTSLDSAMWKVRPATPERIAEINNFLDDQRNKILTFVSGIPTVEYNFEIAPAGYFSQLLYSCQTGQLQEYHVDSVLKENAQQDPFLYADITI